MADLDAALADEALVAAYEAGASLKNLPHTATSPRR
jgi:hypothetical protein